MTKFVLDKDVITAKVLAIIDPDYSAEKFRIARITWWKNIRSSGGLGLTDLGNECFQQAEIVSTEHKFDVDVLPWTIHLLALDKKITCPYFLYVKNRRAYVVLYDDRVSVMCVLHGSVKAYLDTLCANNVN